MKNPFKKLNFKKLFGKKTTIVTLCALVIAVGAIIGFTALNRKGQIDLARNNLAEARFYMKQAQTDTLKIQFYSGMREEPYEMNGIAEKTTAFAIINVDPKDSSLKEAHELRGTIKIGEELIEVTLDRNPYDKNFAADISRFVEVEKEITFTLFLSDTETPTFTLVNAMPESAITWERALEIATERTADKLKEQKQFETYVKIISDLSTESGAFWYIQFVTTDGKTHFCVVAPDGSVVG